MLTFVWLISYDGSTTLKLRTLATKKIYLDKFEWLFTSFITSNKVN